LERADIFWTSVDGIPEWDEPMTIRRVSGFFQQSLQSRSAALNITHKKDGILSHTDLPSEGGSWRCA
jgi:hypothetical protein